MKPKRPRYAFLLYGHVVLQLDAKDADAALRRAKEIIPEKFHELIATVDRKGSASFGVVKA